MILPFHFQVIFRFHVSFQGCTIHLGIIYFNPIPDHPCMVYLPAFGDCLTVIFPLSFYGDVPPSYDASIGSIADELPTLPTALTPRMPPRWGVSALPLHPWDWQKGCPAQQNRGMNSWNTRNPPSQWTKYSIWVFPKIVGFPPKSSTLIGFSIF